MARIRDQGRQDAPGNGAEFVATSASQQDTGATASEPYVISEIKALRARGVQVMPCSVRTSEVKDRNALQQETEYFTPVRGRALLRSLVLTVKRCHVLVSILREIVTAKGESFARRIRALLQTALGVYFAGLMEDQDIRHVHVHHGYFASWVAMVAARVLGISYSITFHGSDILVHRTFLATKLQHCRFCVTISEFNRTVLLSAHRGAAGTVFVRHMGVSVPTPEPTSHCGAPFSIFAAGRLHPVKDFDFLLVACRKLLDSGFDFRCTIAGEGGERKRLEELLDRLYLRGTVSLVGQLSLPELEAHYRTSDLFVLTSRSEGIPLVLMEAMARQNIVLAPRMTGIPELVIDGKTGFLYAPGDLVDFIRQVRWIERFFDSLRAVRRAARAHVIAHFEREKNVAAFCDLLISQVEAQNSQEFHAHPVLQ